MQRSSAFSAAAVAGLCLLLVACAGETPTSPKPAPTPSGSGSCAVTISLPTGPIEAFANTAVTIRAQVAKNGQAVPDNSSVNFTTDFGFFNDNGLQTIAKSTLSGAADVNPGSFASGTAHVKATFDCGSASVQINFQAPPDSGPYVSDVQPNTGSAGGGDTAIVYGGNFGTSLSAVSSVTFGGVPAAPDSVTNTRISVRTPPYTLKDPAVPETVDVCVRYGGGVAQACKTKAFTYYAINPNKKIFVSNVTPSSGSAAGGESVNVQGGNFGTNVATTRVTFCGLAGSVTAVADNLITVLTPQKTLTPPAVSETCDVLATIDLGKVSQQSAVLPQAYTFNKSSLTPTIYSVSPRTGPNDAPTRVTIFGTGFEFPAQVFMTGGKCASQRIEIPVVSSLSSTTTIVVQTPVAAGAYACLAGSQVDIEVLNPTSGKKASFAGGFTFYPCPSAIVASPSVIPTGSSTAVVVTGNNFEEPVEATFETTSAPAYRLTVSSVSSTSVVVQMPPLATIVPNAPSCQSYVGSIKIKSTNLACDAVSVPITYRADTPTISGFSPTTATQPGGTPVTVTGTGFGSSMTAAVTKDGAAIGVPVVATVYNGEQLNFVTPYIPDSAFNRQACTGGGTQAIPTTFGVRVTNTLSGCSNTLSGLVITPTNQACTSALSIVTSTLPAAVVCTGYSQGIAVTGGVAPYFNYTATGLPTGLSINSSTGIVSGTPLLAAAGPGGSVPMTVVVGVTDTASTTVTKSIPILFSDPTGPFSVTGTSPQSVPATGSGPASAFSVSGGTGTINWTIDSGPAGLSLFTPTGTTNSFVSSGLAAGSYAVTVRATDSLPCSPAHTRTVTVTVNSP
ncbi:MAG TPA: IPT/TIG domain-containing protein [Thermoanaerobaculia bacterium]|nr:IPT/TIG domain-containing protein [Thermoanaerobaculia bacterium]HQR67225.1 IPT/TIG domain-containing protein [Thermoanaerobaculia bacterium]